MAALLLFIHAGPALAAGPAIPLGLPDEAILRGLGPLSCRAGLPDDDPTKNKPCSRDELLKHGTDQQSFYVALTVLTEVLPGDMSAAELVLTSMFTRRAVVSEPGAEVTIVEIASQPKQYTGWDKGRLSPAAIARHLPKMQQLTKAFMRGDFDGEPLRFTHYSLCSANPSWMQAARRAGIKILETSDGHCWITGTAEEPALILWPRPAGARKGVSWRRVRDNAPVMFAAIHGPRGLAAGLAMR